MMLRTGVDVHRTIPAAVSIWTLVVRFSLLEVGQDIRAREQRKRNEVGVRWLRDARRSAEAVLFSLTGSR
jgi:hypothetical protein